MGRMRIDQEIEKSNRSAPQPLRSTLSGRAWRSREPGGGRPNLNRAVSFTRSREPHAFLADALHPVGREVDAKRERAESCSFARQYKPLA